jgi:hypothetical protein
MILLLPGDRKMLLPLERVGSGSTNARKERTIIGIAALIDPLKSEWAKNKVSPLRLKMGRSGADGR